MSTHLNSWKKLKYKNLILLGVCIGIVTLLVHLEPFKYVLAQINQLGYFGAFIGGVLFVFTFTVALGGVILFSLADSHSIFIVSLVAGLGGTLGDLVIFRFVKDGLMEEITPLYRSVGGDRLTRIFKRSYLHFMLPVIGAIIIASPLPDEIGVSLMGISHIRTSYFVLISFFLNTIGLFLLLEGVSVVESLLR